MATTKAHSSTTARVNDGGTVRHAGSADGTGPITNPKNLNDLATGSEYGSKVKADVAVAHDHRGVEFTDPHGVTTAWAGGTGGIAYYPDHRAGERNFILRAAGDSASKINNATPAAGKFQLHKGGAEFDGVGRHNIHHMLKTRSNGVHTLNVLAVPSSGIVPGRVKGSTAGVLVTMSGCAGGTATDDAATPTRAVPGELTYHFGGLGKPTTDEYKASDSYES